jgi:hypothetical protein
MNIEQRLSILSNIENTIGNINRINAAYHAIAMMGLYADHVLLPAYEAAASILVHEANLLSDAEAAKLEVIAGYPRITIKDKGIIELILSDIYHDESLQMGLTDLLNQLK